MPRRYHSPRRIATAAQTRLDIVEAAVRLHSAGVTDLADLAREAGVALPTVRKHFATRERVFEACTAHVGQLAQPVPLADLADIADPEERVSRAVQELFERFEARLGMTWTAYRLAGESPAFGAALERNRILARRVAEMLVDRSTTARPTERQAALIGFIQGLLSPLVYRALRIEGGLDLAAAAAATAGAIHHALASSQPS